MQFVLTVGGGGVPDHAFVVTELLFQQEKGLAN
jgi:hypothetical protein